MANQIGTESFDVFSGEIQVPATAIQPHDRIGRDYTRVRDIGFRSKQSTIRTVTFKAGAADALALRDVTYPGMQGTIVTIVDSLNNSYENCTVLDMTIDRHKTVIETGGGTKIVAATWTILAGEQT